jgi:hypothetical protein
MRLPSRQVAPHLIRQLPEEMEEMASMAVAAEVAVPAAQEVAVPEHMRSAE